MGGGGIPAYAEEYAQLKTLCDSNEPPLVLDAFCGLVVAAQYRYLYDTTLRVVPAGSRVLDWGCGDGHFTHFLLSRGYRVESFSLQNRPPLFDRLPSDWRPRHMFTQGTPGEAVLLPYRERAFDAVFSVGVLEHVRESGGDESGSLAEIVRVLRPAGLFVCFHLPNRLSYIEWISRHVFRDSADDEHRRYHLNRYSPTDLDRMLAASGFRVVSRRRYGLLPRNVLGRLPATLRDSGLLTRLANSVDGALESLLPPITQNIGVVAGRRDE